MNQNQNKSNILGGPEIITERDIRLAILNILEDSEEEKRIAENERDKTKAIINNLADGLIIINGENRIFLINPQAEKLLRVRQEEIGGEVLSDLIKFSSLEKLAGLLVSKKELFREELILKEPKELILEVTTTTLPRREEKIVILRDVSREKLIDRMKTEFVSFAAHQLRAPLAAIKWAIKMFLEGDLGKVTKEQRGFLEKTYQTNEKLILLVNDLLNVTRMEEGRYLYKPILADIVKITQSVIDSYKEGIQKKKVKFELKKPKEKLPEVLVDLEKIKLVIDNLLSNAIKYTPSDGKVTITIARAKKEIEFSIKDTGIGIPKDQKEKVFSKFFRGTNALKTGAEGTGLGLFITKNIVEAHEGKIWFESEEGKGTTFFFTLPIPSNLTTRK